MSPSSEYTCSDSCPSEVDDVFEGTDLSSRSDENESPFEKALNQLAKFFSNDNTVGEDIYESCGNIVSRSLRHRPNDETTREIMEKYPCPRNLTNFAIPENQIGNQDVKNALFFSAFYQGGLTLSSWILKLF